jgi:hypothetical protein
MVMATEDTLDIPRTEPSQLHEDPASSLSDLFERLRDVSRRINERVRRVAPDHINPDGSAVGSDSAS